jgi:transposase
MQRLGEDVSEQLARVAAAFKVIRTIRHKLCCPDCGHIEQPAMPSLPIEHSIAHPSLLADIAVSKFADHQPLYRQSEIAARDGVTLDRASMGRWIGQIAELCGPLVEAIQRYVLVPGKVHVDDTPVAVLAPGNGKTVTGRFWVYVRDDHRSGSTEPAAVWFDFSSNRKGVHPQTRLAAFRGILQADAYAGFDQLYASGEIHEAACWDHARRYIYDVHARTPTSDTQQLLEMIGELYSIEADIRGKAPDERLRFRQEKSKPLLAKLEETIRVKLATLSTKSALAKAINYSLNHWAALVFYCEDGRVEISNVLAENALPCVALGRNNAQPEIMLSPSPSNSAMRVAQAIRKDSRFGELRIITTTPGTEGCGPVVDIDDSLLAAAESSSTLAPSLSDQLPYSHVLSMGFRVPAIRR